MWILSWDGMLAWSLVCLTHHFWGAFREENRNDWAHKGKIENGTLQKCTHLAYSNRKLCGSFLQHTLHEHERMDGWLWRYLMSTTYLSHKSISDLCSPQEREVERVVVVTAPTEKRNETHTYIYILVYDDINICRNECLGYIYRCCITHGYYRLLVYGKRKWRENIYW